MVDTLIEEGIFAALTQDSGLLTWAAGRVFPLRLPDDVLLPPGQGALTYQRISTIIDQTHDGPSGLVNPRFQITCFTDGNPLRAAEGKLTCLRGAKLVKRALNGLQKAWGELDASVMLINEIEKFEPESQTWMEVLDFMIWHQD